MPTFDGRGPWGSALWPGAGARAAELADDREGAIKGGE